MKEASDVKRATETVESVKSAVASLDGQLAEDMAAVNAKFDQDAELERIPLAPKRGQIEVQFVALAWSPRAGA
jgi:copper chaperone CopZ